MSRPIDYSKFDHIDDNDSDHDEGTRSGVDEAGAHARSNSQPPLAPTPAPIARTKKSEHNGRYIFECNGHKVYEWEQNLEEVNIYINAPPIPNFKASMLDIIIEPKKLRVGLKGNDRYFIDEETFSKVDTSESMWYVDTDGDEESNGGGGTRTPNNAEMKVIHIVLIKAFRGEVWDSALIMRTDIAQAAASNQAVDPLTKEQIKKDMMLERFQEENPNFDFRNAEFNGEIPDPRNFMGGIGYNR